MIRENTIHFDWIRTFPLLAKKHWKEGLMLASLAAVLSTVFVVDDFLWQGIVTAKYFWFASAMCVVSLLICLFLPGKGNIRMTDIWWGILVVYICLNFFVRNGHPNMHWWLFLLTIPLYVAVRTISEHENLRRWVLHMVLVVILAEAVLGLLQLYGFTRSHHSLYKITGSLFNPGPFSGFVAVGVPLSLGYVLNKTLPPWERWLGALTLAVCLLVLPAAMSRAAWIAAIAGSVLTIIQSIEFKISSLKFQVRGWRQVVLVAAAGLLVVGLLAGAYFLKKDSADGRWLIWRASMESVKEHPVFGAGHGRFAAIYGDAQAAYFLEGKGNEAQIMVADSPEYAFNEYVQMTVELGIIGLVLFLFTVVSSLITHHSKPKTRDLKPETALVTLLVFAAFSYPFNVLPLGILFVFLLALSVPSSQKFMVTLPIWVQVIGMVACWGITAYGTYQILPKRTAYREWSTLQMLYHANAYNEATKEYRTWYPALQHEKQFLFEYGQCLSKTGQYEESNRIFEQYLRYGSDPMVYNCMGNNFKAMDQLQQAENAYLHASQIVPNRHYPLYLLMKLYQESGQTAKAKMMAETLLQKPVKVPSTAIREMQEEARELKIKNEE